jgi:hypothetical protein
MMTRTWPSFILCLKFCQKNLTKESCSECHGHGDENLVFFILCLKSSQVNLTKESCHGLGVENMVPSSFTSNSVRETRKGILSWTWRLELGAPSSFVLKSVRKTLQKVPVVHEDENLVLLLPSSQKPSEKMLQWNSVMNMRTRTWSSIVLCPVGPRWFTVLCLSRQKT